jgi:DHA1 family multidrug resistance protein-like MFS transporter
MATNREHISPGTLAVGACTVAVVGLGYGIALPLLPVMISELITAPGPSDIAWHTSLLTGVFAIAPLIAAGPWGLLSDRHGRRPILIVGMLGFALTLAATAFPTTLFAFYLLRLLNGAFAAAIVPSVLALVTDLERDESRRARTFALVSAASSIGLLAGPMVGGVAADLPPLPFATDFLPSWRPLPFLGVTGLALAAAGAVALVRPSSRSPSSSASHEHRDKLGHWGRASLVLLAALVAAGLSLFEVGLTLQSRALAIAPSALGFMFAGCMVIMLLVQVLVFSPLARPAVTQWFISPAFLLLGSGLLLVVAAPGGSGLMMATAGVAAAGGFLAPALAYWLSYGSGRRAGAQLGLQSAAVSVGQALGATGTVGLLSNSIVGAASLVGLTIGSAAVALAVSIYLGRSANAVPALPISPLQVLKGKLE